MQSLQTLLAGGSSSSSCHLCQNHRRCQPSARLLTTARKSANAPPQASPSQTPAEKLFADYMAEYTLLKWHRRQVLVHRAVWGAVAAGSAYGLCRLWETHQSRKSDPNSFHLPMLGSQTNLQRWSLIGPYAVALVGSGCVFGLWRMGVAKFAAAESKFLRLFVDRPGLGVGYSRPLLSPLFSAFSHRTWGHFLINQLVLLSVVGASIGKLSPGEFVAFGVSSAYVTSLVNLLAMSATNRFACSYGASGVLSAMVAFNALTDEETRRVWRDPLSPGSGGAGGGHEDGDGASESEGSSLALFGVIPLPWLSPPVGVAVWAACEAACLAYEALWRRRVPRFNHPVHLAGIAFGSVYAWRGHQLLWSDLPVPKHNHPLPAR